MLEAIDRHRNIAGELSIPELPEVPYVTGSRRLSRLARFKLERGAPQEIHSEGFIEYNGGLQVHSSLLNIVLHDLDGIRTVSLSSLPTRTGPPA